MMMGKGRLSGIRVTLTTACAAVLLTAALPGVALAYVSNTDIVAGKPMAERDLTIAQQIDIQAPFACMIDNYGEIYFERGAHEPLKIASGEEALKEA